MHKATPRGRGKILQHLITQALMRETDPAFIYTTRQKLQYDE